MTTKPTRPGEGDRAVLAAAAKAFAEDVVARHKDYVGDTDAAGFADDLLRVLPVWGDDGTQLAQDLRDRGGYPFDLQAVEVMGLWPDYLRSAADDAVRRWVSETGPSAPFERLARVVVEDRRGDYEGSAYRTPEYDLQARCLVVPDAERSRYVLDGAFAGGTIVAWERVASASEAAQDDVRAYEAMLARDVRSARERAYRSFAYTVDKAFADAARAAAGEVRGLADGELAARLAASLEAMAGEVRAGAGDPFSGASAMTHALLDEARERARRSMHARERSTAESPEAAAVAGGAVGG